MARATLVRREWHGEEFKARERRANGRAIIGMGVSAANEMSRHAHRVSGDLSRSTHAAKKFTMGAINATPETAREGVTSWGIEVGSWLPYACVENNLGGTHRFADLGWQTAEPTFDAKIIRAWREEGL